MQFKQQIKQSMLYNIYLQIRRHHELWQWRRNGQPIPTPHLIKQGTLIEYAKQFQLDILVETGTYMGETVFAMRNKFQRIYSIELNPSFARRARLIFSSKPHITILQGDSAMLLPEVLSEIDRPCLFWLDAHYSGGNTLRGELNTPIMQELRLILDHPVKKHVILIDDARLFVGSNDYPELDTLESMIADEYSEWTFDVKNDIIEINTYPNND